VARPLPELKKLPGASTRSTNLFIEITNAWHFKCTWCPTRSWAAAGLHAQGAVFALLQEIAQKRSWLGPLYP